jgi:hypothetical protein
MPNRLDLGAGHPTRIAADQPVTIRLVAGGACGSEVLDAEAVDSASCPCFSGSFAATPGHLPALVTHLGKSAP